MDRTEKLPFIEFCAGALGLSEGARAYCQGLFPVTYCEIEGYAVANMVAAMEQGRVSPAPVWTDLKTFPAQNFRGRVWAIMAGYPCQPFSHAGQRGGGRRSKTPLASHRKGN